MAGEARRLLVAPCGMDCGVCSHYLAYDRKIPRRTGHIIHCAGCRPRGKECAFLKGSCQRLARREVEFCFQCDDFPCERLKALDRRYRTRYGTSLIGNLERIRDVGIEAFLNEQLRRYRCPSCGGTLSIHSGKCYDCERIDDWRG